jgi:hypothetical protein
MSKFRVLFGATVFAVLVAWFTSQALPASRDVLAANQSFAIVLPVMVRLESGQLFQAPKVPVADTTDTPTATLTATPTNTPTITPSAMPTNTPECDLEIEQNLKGRLRSSTVGDVSNSSASCTYAVGLASYRMFDDNLSHQQLFSSQTALIGPGETLTFTIDLPDCAYQLDLFYGPLIETFDPQHGQIYGRRILTSRVIQDTGFCVPGAITPTIISTPSATPTGSPTPTLTATDTPTPTGGGN